MTTSQPANFTNKELYIMNGGNKLYIFKDGFGDVYNATPAEEAAWAREIVEAALLKINNEQNTTSLKMAVDNLLFHEYYQLEELLISHLADVNLVRRIVFATALWRIYKSENSFAIIKETLENDRLASLDTVFQCLIDFKDNAAAKQFIVACLEGDDEVLTAKAHQTIGMWAYTGIPALRENCLLDLLKFKHRDDVAFSKAVARLKGLLNL